MKNYLAISSVAIIAVFSIFTQTDYKKRNNPYSNYRENTNEGVAQATQDDEQASLPGVYRSEFRSAETFGQIGPMEGLAYDDPHDNVFSVVIDREPGMDERAFLEYEVFGVADFNSVCRSVNDEVSFGGMIVKASDSWSVQREEIPAGVLRKGENKIRFSVGDGQELGYTIKNVGIRFEQGEGQERSLRILRSESDAIYDRKVYVRGMISGRGHEDVRVRANGEELRVSNGMFEGFAQLSGFSPAGEIAEIEAVFADGEVLREQMVICGETRSEYLIAEAMPVRRAEVFCTPKESICMELDGFTLEGEAGSVAGAIRMHVTGLRTQDMPLMKQGMVNVTGGHAGYRCLPHGAHFESGVEVRISFDSSRLPAGYGPKDVYTYYYDEHNGDWVMLPRDSVDLVNGEIVSKTTHFTDFINAILKTPESPQTQAFTPTSMKDMKFADPLAGINLMQAPSANNNGTANMSLPIVVPAGRQGLQPQLAIGYNSEGGNGMLGVGWGLSIPSVSVETRWGVPRYSQSYETEEYLVNGQQVVELLISPSDTERLPLVHMSQYRARNSSSEVIYSYRVEGAFDRIIRHETSPSSYWWEVIDKQGTHYYYGKYATDAGVNSNCVLKNTSNGNVAQWLLAEVRDVYGNSMRYNYTQVVRQSGAGANGHQMYVSSIQYTGYGSTVGKYSVEFEYDGGYRGDYMISAKYGFLEVSDRLLTAIHVKYDGGFVRSYHIKYKDGAYGKKLVCAIAEVTDASKLGQVVELSCGAIDSLETSGVKVHSFEYYEEEGLDFGGEVLILSAQELPEEVGGGMYTVSTTQGIGRSKSTNASLGGSLCVGIGDPTNKSNSIGVNMNFSLATISEKVSFLDLNGDGLKDKIIRNGSSFNFHLGYLDANNQLIFENSPTVITSLPNLGCNWSSSVSLGGEFQANLANLSGSASISWTRDKSMTNKYFADVNADGYLDYVHEGDVYFNYPDPSNHPEYTIESSAIEQVVGDDDCYSIFHDGTIDPTLSSNDDETYYYRRDPVRMWVVPMVGEDGQTNVKVISEIQRQSTQGGQHDVRYTIQHNNTIVHCGYIAANDFNSQNLDLCISNVSEGDRIYFRLLADDDIGVDEVNWNTELYTVSCSTTTSGNDADGKAIHNYSYEEDAVIHDYRYFIAPLTGVINVSGTLNSNAQSDDLQFIIKHNQTVVHNASFAHSVAIQNHSFNYNLSVTEGDSIPMKLISNTNVNWSDIDFDALIKYTSASNFTIIPGSTFNEIEYYPSLRMSIFPKRNKIPEGYSLAANSYTIYPSLSYSGTGTYTGEVVLSAKTLRHLLDEEVLQVVNGVIQGSPTLQFTLAQGETVFFDYYTIDQDLSDDVVLSRVYYYLNGTVNLNAGYYSVFTEEMKQYGNLYRGWGQFSYYDSQQASSCSLIDQSALSLNFTNMSSSYLESFPLSSITSGSSYSDVQTIFNTFGVPDLNTLKFVPMLANREKTQWEDFGKSAYTDEVKAGSGGVFGELLSMVNDPDVFDSGEGPVPNFDNPIPSGSISGYPRAWGKKSVSTNESFSFSGSTGPASVSTTVSVSQSKAFTDYNDMNGDRYPDFIGDEKIQYTTPYGGISTDIFQPLQPEFVNKGNASSAGFTIGLGGILHEGTTSRNQNSSKMNNARGSFGAGVSTSNSDMKLIYADVNGDGLPDRVNASNNTVAYNTGYGFTNAQAMTVNAISESNSTTESVNLNLSFFNLKKDSWAGGVGGSIGENFDKKSLMDINNDGLADVVVVLNNNVYAYLNTGNGFTTAQVVSGSAFTNHIRKSLSYGVNGNLAATYGIPFFLSLKATMSGYLSASYSVTSDQYRLDDLNGDGYLDFVFVDGLVVKAKYGLPKKTNVLKKVKTPAASEFTVDYNLLYPSRENPSAKWVMSSLVVFDGFTGDGEDYMYTAFEYENPVHHRMERDFFGYEVVKTKQYNHFGPGAVCYRTNVEKFHNEDFLFKGLKKYECLYSGTNIELVETEYVWDAKEIPTGNIVTTMPQCFEDVYPAISQEDKIFHDEQTTNVIHTSKTYRHGRYGNVKQYINFGDVSYADDDLRAEIAYTYNLPANYLGMVASLEVYDAQNAMLRTRSATYTSLGRVENISSFDGSVTAEVDLTYDIYGNIAHIVFPEDVNSDRLEYTYSYDGIVHSYPEEVTDYWGNTSYTEYDFKLGVPILMRDMALNEMHLTYYDDGKPKTVTGPKEIANSIAYTIKFEYWDEPGGSTSANRWAMTRHYDPMNTNNEFITVNFSDGLGRSIQSKKKAVIGGVERVVVSGNVLYDSYGRAVSVSLPIDEAPGTETTFSSFSNSNVATTTYDVQDRPLLQTAPDLSTVEYTYGLASDAWGVMCFASTVTDPNQISTTQYKNARGLNTSVEAPGSTVTKFAYSPLGELIKSIDPEGHETHYSYDLAGRLLTREHPDAGLTQYTYDGAGNVLNTQTQTLINNSQYIDYVYDDCRLSSIVYPQNPEMNVYYEYGAPNSGNQSGRLVKQQDASGVQTFEYGDMGELIKNIHTFVVPGGLAYTFETNWEYDSWNRMKNITYPDGEVVTYHYNDGGQLVALDGVKGQNNYAYIDNIEYNRYGARTLMEYGNGTYSEYTYDALNQRLTNLTSYEASSAVMQSIDYTYDDASNITGIDNESDYLNGNLGGDYTYSFTYDDLYRLTQSEGSFTSYFSGVIGFVQNMEYSASGNITRKSVVAEEEIGGSVVNVNYDRYYSYNDRPHNVTSTGDFDYTWDANGNQVYRLENNTGFRRYLCWDEENRLTTVRNYSESVNNVSSYVYDAGGERAWKLAGDVYSMYINGVGYVYGVEFDKTLYVNPYMVMDEAEYTKHYYIEGERVCTKIGSGFNGAPTDPTSTPLTFMNCELEQFTMNLWNMITRGVECTEFEADYVTVGKKLTPAGTGTNGFEDFQYFYHSDHLGSSSFITDAIGYATQHLQYLPFGETFVDQKAGSFDSRYKFSAKEKDDETQYSYFGARYYDSDLSVWLSVDPMASERSWVSPYNYCQNNPIGRVDPTGALDDGYTVDLMGRINKVDNTGGDDFDVLYNKADYDAGKRDYDESGTKSGMKIDKNTINESVEIPALKGETEAGSGFRIKSKESAEKLFWFVSENSKVEIGLIHTKDNGSVLFTNHDHTRISATATAVNLDSKGETVTDIAHSHPLFIFQGYKTKYGPSDPDLRNAGKFEKSKGYMIDYWIYNLEDSKVLHFDKNGVYYSEDKNSFARKLQTKQ